MGNDSQATKTWLTGVQACTFTARLHRCTWLFAFYVTVRVYLWLEEPGMYISKPVYSRNTFPRENIKPLLVFYTRHNGDPGPEIVL